MLKRSKARRMSCLVSRLAVMAVVVLVSLAGNKCYTHGFSSGFHGGIRRPFVCTTMSPRTRSVPLFYEEGNNGAPPAEESGSGSVMWTALADTERWIGQTLPKLSSAGVSRKEVSYVCEVHTPLISIVSGIFRRLREARELGESHGRVQEELRRGQGSRYEPTTFRQTQVVVIPSSDILLSSFQVFDDVINRINQARRNSRDLVTTVASEEEEEQGEAQKWSVGVSCSHLHPRFGEKVGSEGTVQQQEEEEESEELKRYKEQRLAARKSPYPSIVLEVKAIPPMEFEAPPPAQGADMDDDDDGTMPQVTRDQVMNLEAMLGKSAAMNHPTVEEAENSSPEWSEEKEREEAFYDAIGKSTGINEITFITPTSMALDWVAENDPSFNVTTASFSDTDTTLVDAAYEFVFNSIALRDSQRGGEGTSYLVMSRFLTKSSTSLEQFAKQVASILEILPDLARMPTVSTAHPEHVDTTKRSPFPIIMLQW